MKNTLVNLVQANAKSIVAFLCTLLAVQFAKRGLSLDTNVQEALQTVCLAIVSGGLVWLKANKQ